MKKLVSVLLVTILPAIMAYLNMDDVTKKEVFNNVTKTVRSHFLKQKIIAVLMFAVFLGILGGFLHSRVPAVVLNAEEANEIADALVSTSCTYGVLGVIGPFGEASPQIAANKARISNIIMIDYYQQNYIFIQRNCIRVYGLER